MAPSKELRGGGQKLQAENAPSRWRAYACRSPPCWSSSPFYAAAETWSSSWKHGRRPTQLANEDVRSGRKALGSRLPTPSEAGQRQSALRAERPNGPVPAIGDHGELPGLTLCQLEQGLPSRSERAGKQLRANSARDDHAVTS